MSLQSRLSAFITSVGADIKALYALDQPSGTLLEFAGTVLPANYLWCDGTAVSRTTYAKLYAALGGAASPWGQGDGSTTFNTPDTRGRVVVGAGTGSGLTARALGAKAGVEAAIVPTHTHTNSVGTESADHAHSGTTGTDSPDHSHGTAPDVTWAGTGSGSVTRKGGAATSQTGGASARHAHAFSTGGRNAAHNHAVTIDAAGVSPTDGNLQPSVVMNYIIRI